MYKRLLILISFILLSVLGSKAAPDTVVDTFAGLSGVDGATDDRAGAARFNGSVALELDRSSGDLYVADTDSHTIRRISRTMDVKTIAGANGQEGTTNATGSSARFSYPQATTIDNYGNIYVAERNNTIRKITPEGVVSLYAGAPGVAANIDGVTSGAPEFGTATQAAVDSSGNLYVADTSNHTIRKVTAAGVVTTLAGTAGASGTTNNTGSAARFNSPTGIVVLANGNMLVADKGNNLIRKVTSAGVVTTFAGNGDAQSIDATGASASFNEPYGLARDAAGNVYVAEKGSHLVRKITSAAVVTTIAGSAGVSGTADGSSISTARFNSPTGVVVDSSNNIYIADEANNAIRKIADAGLVSSLHASFAATGMSSDVDSNGNVYYASGHAIYKLTTAGVLSVYAGSVGTSGFVNAQGTSARFNSPQGVVVDDDDNLYVTDGGNGAIRKINTAVEVTTLVGGGNGYSDSVTGVAASRFNTPAGIVTDSAGNKFVTDHLNHTIRKIDSSGKVTLFAGLPGYTGTADGTGEAARFNQPNHITVDNADNLYVSDHLNHCIRKITSAGVVTTLAGLCGTSGSTDATGSSARFNRPVGVWADSSKNVFVADHYNHTIRKITEAGVVTTLAGAAGVLGSVDGSIGAAKFYNPHDVVIDSNGNIFVSDQLNYTIRKITPAGTVSVFAGLTAAAGSTNGTGSAARFNGSGGLAIDADDNIYVGDNTNHCIRKITPAAVVSTFAGTCGTPGYQNGTGPNNTKFNYPAWLTMASNGSLYVTEHGNHTVRKITPGGLVTTLAGDPGVPGCTNGTGSGALFKYPQGIAVSSNGSIFVSEVYNYNHTIRKITPAGVVTTFAGACGQSGSTDATGADARFNQPAEISIDASDNLYVSDFQNHTIRKITPGRVVTTLAGVAGSAGTADGNGALARFSYPLGTTVDSNGDLYLAGYTSHIIRKITSAGLVTTVAGIVDLSGSADSSSTARFNNPYGIDGDSSGNLYVADEKNHTIRKITSTGTVTTIAGSPGLTGSTDHTPASGAQARFGLVEGAAKDSAGNVFIADHSNHTIRKLATDGTVTTFAGMAGLPGSTDGTGSAARFRGPAQIAIDSSDNIYVADYLNHTIRKIEANGDVTTLAGSAGYTGTTDDTGSAARFNNPHGIAVDSSGNVYVGDRYNHSIRKITSGGTVSTLAGLSGTSGTADGAGTAARFNQPLGISVDSSGNLYVADWGNHTLRKVTSTGVVTTIAGSAGLAGSADGSPVAAKFFRPHGMDMDSSNNLYIADNPSHTIRKVTPDGIVTTLAGSAGLSGATNGVGSAARFYEPVDVAVGNADNLYIADNMNHCIRKVSPTGTVSTFAGTCGSAGYLDHATGTSAKFRNPVGIEADASNNLYVAEDQNHTIRKITTGGVVTTIAGAAGISGSSDSGAGGAVPARFNYPHGITMDDNGKLFIADNTNHTIRTMDDNGVIATFAGTAGENGSTNNTGSAASFDFPQAVAKSSNGSLFVTDWTKHLIRKISPAAVVTTFAGTGSSGTADGTGTSASFNRPVGIYVNSSDEIYVVDHYNHCIRKITQAGVVTTFAGLCGTSGSADGTAAARFNYPYMISGDSTGNLYVTDEYNHTVRKISSDGVVSTLAGSAGSAGYIDGGIILGKFNTPTGVVTDSSGNIFVADTANKVIRKVTPAGVVSTFAGTAGSSGTSDGTGSAARFTSPNDIVLNGTNLYVADNHCIRKITNAAVVTTLAGACGTAGYLDHTTGTSARFNTITSLTNDTSGNLYATDTANHLIRKIVISSTAVTTHAGVANQAGSVDGAALTGLAKFDRPAGVVMSSNGSIFVADNLNDVIRKITPAGVITTFAGTAGATGTTDATGSAARFWRPHQLAIDSSDNLYLSDNYNNKIRKITQSAVVTTLAGSGTAGATNATGASASFNSPVGVWVYGGDLFVSDHYNHCIRKVVISTGVVSTFAGTCGSVGSADGTGAAARFNYPYGMSGDASGNLYVADEKNNTIRKITTGGVVTTLAGKAGTAGSTDGGLGGRLYRPHGMVMDSAGNIFVADNPSHTIRKIEANGDISTFAGLANSPGTTNATGTAARFNGPGGLAIDGSDNIYVGDNTNHCIRKITPGGVVTTFVGLCGTSGYTDATGTAARFTYPAWVTMSSNGSLYIADVANHVIRKASSGGDVITLAGTAGATGCVDDTGAAARFTYPQGLAEDSSGNLYVSEVYNYNHTIRMVTPSGDVTTFAGSCGQRGSTDGTGSAARFNSPTEIAIDASDNLYVADFENHTIRKITSGAVVTTLAGTAGSSATTDGTGSAARFAKPAGVLVSNNGNHLYVSEYDGHTIRKVTLPGAVVTTFAGIAGNSGTNDGGASSARFHDPAGIAVDASNNVYVSDLTNSTLRKITSTGVTTTLAGAAGASGSADGTGSAARFYWPMGIVFNGSSIYMADHFNSTIRKITTGGVVTTVAGIAGVTGTTDGSAARAKFSSPRGLAYSANGSLFVADTGNYTIRKINSSGVVSTLAGSAGSSGMTNATGSSARFSAAMNKIRTDSSNNIYLADSSNHNIRKITPAGVVSTLAGMSGSYGTNDGTGGSAGFNYPVGVHVDSSGNIFIADQNNHTIRKSTSVGAVTTVSGIAGQSGAENTGASSARFNTPTGITVSSNGSVYVSEWVNNTIRKITPGGTVSTLAGTTIASGSSDGSGAAARFYRPTGLVANGTNIYVADHFNHSIRKVTSAGVVTTVAGTPTYSGTNDGDDVGARFNQPLGLAFTSNGSLYVADKLNHTIRKINTSGAVTTLAGAAGQAGTANSSTGTSARFNAPSMLSVDSSNNLYVSDFTNHTIRQITEAGAVSIFAGSAGQVGNTNDTSTAARFSSPLGMHVNNDDELFVSEYGNHTIRKVTLPGASVTLFSGSSGTSGSANSGSSTSRFYNPIDTDITSSGDIYVADYGNNTIRKVTPSGVVTTLAGLAGNPGSADGSGSTARFRYPYSISLDGSNAMYVGDQANNTVRRVTTAGVVTTVAGLAGQSGSADVYNSVARFYDPTGVSLDDSGNIYITDYSNHTVRKISTAGAVSTLAGTALSANSTDAIGPNARFRNPAGLVVNGSNIYVADSSNHTIRKIVISTANVTTIAGSALSAGSTNNGGGAQFSIFTNSNNNKWGLGGIAMSNNGDLYVTEYESHRIRKISSAGVVTTYAGVGTFGYLDGAANQAKFNNPYDLAIDGSDNLYVADRNNQMIRKVTPAGVVSTLVSGLSIPQSIVFDGSNSLYFNSGASIMMASLDGVVKTVTGVASDIFGYTEGALNVARFSGTNSSIKALAMHQNGFLILADTGNNRTRKIVLDGLTVTTLAGSIGTSGTSDGTGAAAKFSSPNSLAIDSSNNIYVSDKANHSIRKVTSAGVVTTLAGVAGSAGTKDGAAATAKFKTPTGLAVDGSSNVLVVDSANNSIRKIVSSVVSTLAGSVGVSGGSDGTGVAARFSNPSGLAVDSSGNLYVSDKGNHSIRKINSGIVTTFAGTGTAGANNATGTAASFSSPTGITMDSAGNIYIADTANHLIRKVTSAGVVTTVAGSVGQSGSTNATGTSAKFNNPMDLAVDQSNNIYVADQNNHLIRKISPTGAVSTLAGSTVLPLSTASGNGSTARFTSPKSISVNAEGKLLYVTDSLNSIIRRIRILDNSGGSVGTKKRMGL